ncbi:MAG TPA: alpha/beta hydrolase [Thermoanaerobaculia bacterium]|nr:alpha/beta hydrolase [Thermoanaerobaculia bacterium]
MSLAVFVLISSLVFHDASRARDIPVRVYEPHTAGRHPVVIFSHGIGEDRDSYEYIGRALAQNGFMAVHITHAGMDKAVLRSGYWNLYKATKVADNWRNRPRDVSFVLDQLAKRDDVDMSRVAVAGHSAGAFTAFQLAGSIDPDGQSFRDPRVRAIVAMSEPRIEGVRYDTVRIPVLNITGTRDSSLIYGTRQRHRRIPFDEAHGPDQYLATIGGATHNSFSNVKDRHHDTIVALTVNFLRACLLDDHAALAGLEIPGVTLERK